MINPLRHFRAANHPGRPPRAAIAPRAFPADSRQPTADGRRSSGPRRGISLLEVLISMFVLLFGLMGVAAIFPVGNHYAGKGEQFDRGSALAGAAFADLKARAMLKPELWIYASMPENPAVANDRRVIQPVITPPPHGSVPNTFNYVGNGGPGHVFVIDPLGIAAELAANGNSPANLRSDVFPFAYYSNAAPDGLVQNDPTLPSNTENPWNQVERLPLPGERWPIRRISLPSNNLTQPTMPTAVAETIFRLHDDVTNELPAENDRPGIQRWTAVDNNATPTPKDPSDDTLLARAYTGNYSWLATVVPTSRESVQALQPTNSRFGSDLYEVSVAVFNKRELLPSAETERSIDAVLLQGGELVIRATGNNVETIDAVAQDIRPGNWIALTGVHPTTGQLMLKWYRLLSFDDETLENVGPDGAGNGSFAVRRAMLDGPEWPAPSSTAKPTGYPVTDVRAILLPGVISVATQMLPMERVQ